MFVRSVVRRENAPGVRIPMPRETNKLSAAKVRTLAKPGLYGDGHGLYLRVSTFETKAWVFRYMIDGTARKMGLGPLHTVSLAAPRKRPPGARRKALDGLDPIDARDQQRETRKADAAKAKAEAARALTFKACADAYIKAK